MKIPIICIQVEIGLFTLYKVRVQAFPDTYKHFLTLTRINLMVIGGLGPKHHKYPEKKIENHCDLQ